MKSAHTWFRFYNATMDNEKVLRLTDKQYRVWTTLLCIASKKGGVIPEDAIGLSILLRMESPKVRDMLQVLISRGLIERCDGGYVPHDWKQRQYASDVSNDRVKAHRERKRNVTNDDACNVTVTANETPPETDTESDTETDKKDIARLARAEFDNFWLVCPRKVGKIKAQKAYVKALQVTSPELLRAAMAQYATSQAGKDQQYIVHPATWLNDGRWADETPIIVAQSSGIPTNLEEIQRLEEEARKSREASNVH